MSEVAPALDEPHGHFDDDEDEAAFGPPRWWLHALLLVVSFVSMSAAGMGFAGAEIWALESWSSPKTLLPALSYAACLMAILFSHEMGHYLYCKRHEVVASPPFFLPGLPLPGLGVLPLFGTFGAFIKMQVRPLSAKALLQIGAWGPLAGFIVAVPVLLLGFSLSDVRPLPEDMTQTLTLGDSLLLWLLERAFFPSIPQGHDLFLHPVAMAGWTGAFFTGFNLVPIGQLDGGHIAYSVFGEAYNRLARALWAALVILGVLWFPGWVLLAVFLHFTGPKHPPIIRGPLVTGRARALALISLVIFALTFTPTPFEGVGLLAWLKS